MRICLVIVLFILYSLLFTIAPARAIYDPLSVPNNRIGVHILDPSEVAEAAKLVNSGGGDWGYVTIPIRSNDRDREKWVDFFINCARSHLIPIVRLATYVYKDTWVTPSSYDLVDFANFLAEMPWPVKNRYIILYNEPNHSKEWGGIVDPGHYATILIQAKDIFKSRSEDFFLLSAGLDMSAPSNHTSLDALLFYRAMTKAQPNWHVAVDGYSFHAYPNPAFSTSVYSTTRFGPKSYTYELKYLNTLKASEKPVFITETGTIHSSADFYTPALTSVWTEKNIVAITPFLLFAGEGSFAPFSLFDSHHKPRRSYTDIFQLPKVAGSPLLVPPNWTFFTSPSTGSSSLPGPLFSFIDRLTYIITPQEPTLIIGNTTIKVEVADTPQSITKGLSGRPSLPLEQGVLFVFSSSRPHSFWMYDMKFALDFVWIRNGRIVELNENIPPPAQTGNKPIFIIPKEHADQVLEVNAGFIARHGIKVGDEVDFRP